MKIQELRKALLDKGFREEKKDTGHIYTKVIDHVELISYIEPDIEVEFITIYKWDNNDVKGVYNISVNDLYRSKETPFSLFRKTLADMPSLVGPKNIHAEIEDILNGVFK